MRGINIHVNSQGATLIDFKISPLFLRHFWTILNYNKNLVHATYFLVIDTKQQDHRIRYSYKIRNWQYAKEISYYIHTRVTEHTKWEWYEMKNKNVKNTDKTSSPVQKQLAFLFSLHCSHDSETQNMALIFLFL